MSNRPTPRKSALAGASPVLPPRPATVTTPSANADDAPAIEPKEDKTSRPAESRPRPKYPPKVSFYQAREDTARVRGAILHTGALEGPRSLSQFINDAVMAEVERLEAKYNGGQPFPSVGARVLPQGRPMQE
ncbi:ParB family protein [Sanguibacter massiliensis]|uniref:ParB family protein n=1 Tax=Sanguibacter massiliensis TaxID=1973217 RepID=UPI000C856147|nr:hypothetical protein [Sanguibacter massiliensis]